MKITAIETRAVATGGGGPWMFGIIRTDAGITGYSQFGTGSISRGLTGLVEDIGAALIGKDPDPVERHYLEMYRRTAQARGGAAAMAIAGIELALWDIKGKAAGLPVYRLLGGPFRDRQKVYWSHLASYRAQRAGELGVAPLKTWDDVADCVREATDAGFSAFKTNIIFPGDPSRRMNQVFAGDFDQNADQNLIDHAVRQMSVMREAAGPSVGIALDIHYEFKTEAAIRLAQALEPYNLMWLEFDRFEPEPLAQIKSSTRTPICTGEQLLGVREYKRFFDLRALDTVKIDVPWQGFTQSRKVADLAEIYEINIAPHNYTSHLATFQSLQFTAMVPNVRIMETDVDSSPWRDELTTAVPELKDGFMTIPDGPGWGCDLDEAAAKKHAYNK
ncbi:MAG: mandelate racemase/muconate lactonizing enzyme family protein [Chloroflexi bacterium]|nr:mandelate racemase/muconate lactonizing enzyme family protein [Chloroflexota bacterium]